MGLTAGIVGINNHILYLILYISFIALYSSAFYFFNRKNDKKDQTSILY